MAAEGNPSVLPTAGAYDAERTAVVRCRLTVDDTEPWAGVVGD